MSYFVKSLSSFHRNNIQIFSDKKSLHFYGFKKDSKRSFNAIIWTMNLVIKVGFCSISPDMAML